MSASEKYTVSGARLLERVKQLLYEGNIRRVRIIHKERTLLDIPVTVGAPAAALMIMMIPTLTAVGALAALLTECTLEVERKEE
jgi:Domain of unknown function (DUF4342)